ncbi:1184_t:CDS:2, partial [Racocetra persica]
MEIVIREKNFQEIISEIYMNTLKKHRNIDRGKANELLNLTINPWKESGAKKILNYLTKNYGSNVYTAKASTSASAMNDDVLTTLTHDTSTLTETITQDVLDVSRISTFTSGENYESKVPTAIANTLASAMSDVLITVIHDTSTITETITQEALDVSTFNTSTSGDIPHDATAGAKETLIDDLNPPITNNVSAKLMHNTNTPPTADLRKTLSEDVSNICATMSNIRTSSTREISDEDFDDFTWIQSVGYELREEAQNQIIQCIESESNIKLLIHKYNEMVKEVSELKESVGRMHYKNELLEAEKRLLNYDI